MSKSRGVHRTRRVKIPIGIEKVLVKAASDPVFRQALLDNRESALQELGTDLSDAEFEILKSIPNDSLLTMVSHVDLKKHARRKFMKGVMTAAFVAASAATMAECSRNMVQGAQADDPPKKAATIEAQELHYDGGAAPEMPEEPPKPKPPEAKPEDKPDDLEVDTPVTRGIDPDTPPPPPPADDEALKAAILPGQAGVQPNDPGLADVPPLNIQAGARAPELPLEPQPPAPEVLIIGTEEPKVNAGAIEEEPPPLPPQPADVIEQVITPVPAGIPPMEPSPPTKVEPAPDPETRIINEMTIGGISPSDGPLLEIDAPETMGEGGHDPSLDD